MTELETQLLIAEANADKAHAELKIARMQLRKARIEDGEESLNTRLQKASAFLNERAEVFQSKIMRHVLRATAGCLVDDNVCGQELVALDEKLKLAEIKPDSNERRELRQEGRAGLIIDIKHRAQRFKSVVVREVLWALATDLESSINDTLIKLDEKYIKSVG